MITDHQGTIRKVRGYYEPEYRVIEVYLRLDHVAKVISCLADIESSHHANHQVPQ